MAVFLSIITIIIGAGQYLPSVLVLGLTISFFGLAVTIYLTGLAPNVLVYDARVLVTYLFSLAIVIIPLIVLSFMNPIYPLAAVLLLIPAGYLVRRSYPKWERADIEGFGAKILTSSVFPRFIDHTTERDSAPLHQYNSARFMLCYSMTYYCKTGWSIVLDLIFSFLLAVLPILVIFVGLVFLNQSGTRMGIIGWILTVVLAVLFFGTSPQIALYASENGILSSFGISLMVLFTILQVTMMDLTGAITSITAYIKVIAAERYEQIMILNVGFGSFLVSIGATPVTMLPPIMLALGFSPLAAVALPCLGYDPLTSFSLLAVPITLPASAFNIDVSLFGGTIALFLPVVSTGFALGMLWIADGIEGVKKGLVPGIIAGITLGVSCNIFVRVLPASAIGLVGVFSGLVTIAVLFLYRYLRGKPIIARNGDLQSMRAADGTEILPLWKASFPWLLLVFFCILISIPFIQSGLYALLGDAQKIHVIANKIVDLKLLNQAYFWVLISTLLSAPVLVKSRAQAQEILRVWIRRAGPPTVAAAVFFAIAYVMDWSGQSVINNTLTFAPGAADLNMNAVIGLTLALTFGIAFPAISPLLGLLGTFVSGSETSSNVMFYGILKKSTGVLDLDFIKVYSAHAVSGGIASAIAPAKIVNAAAVIDQIGIEGAVIRKSAVIAILLTLVTSVMLVILLAL